MDIEAFVKLKKLNDEIHALEWVMESLPNWLNYANGNEFMLVQKRYGSGNKQYDGKALLPGCILKEVAEFALEVAERELELKKKQFEKL